LKTVLLTLLDFEALPAVIRRQGSCSSLPSVVTPLSGGTWNQCSSVRQTVFPQSQTINRHL